MLTNIAIVFGIPCLAISVICSAFIGARDLVDNLLWRRDRKHCTHKDLWEG